MLKSFRMGQNGLHLTKMNSNESSSKLSKPWRVRYLGILPINTVGNCLTINSNSPDSTT